MPLLISLFIDGGVNPPQFYHSAEEIERTRAAAGRMPTPASTYLTYFMALLSDLFFYPLDNRPVEAETEPAASAQGEAPAGQVNEPPIEARAQGEPALEAEPDTQTGTFPYAAHFPSINYSPTCLEPTDPVEGHLVSVTMVHTSLEKTTGRNRATTKTSRLTKSDRIVITPNMSRSEFVVAFLQVHDLSNTYMPGIACGPSFKFWFTGSK